MSEERRQGSRTHAGTQQGSAQREVVHRDGAAPATRLTAVLGLRTQAGVDTTDHPLVFDRLASHVTLLRAAEWPRLAALLDDEAAHLG